MKLLHAEIAAFGKFYRRSFSFQDGIHVIGGPNEAGKSTLHAFIGAMLFGLEIVRHFLGDEAVERVRAGVVLR